MARAGATAAAASPPSCREAPLRQLRLVMAPGKRPGQRADAPKPRKGWGLLATQLVLNPKHPLAPWLCLASYSGKYLYMYHYKSVFQGAMALQGGFGVQSGLAPERQGARQTWR